jgi:ubiquinone/menaquinone biosynthesis C-methylase UbiE
VLGRARARLGGRVAFVAADLTAGLPMRAGAFDLALCCLALEHVRVLGPVFGELARVTRAGGAVVVTDMHPAMRLRGNQAQFDDADGTEVRVEGFEHPIVDYVTAALAAGLRIECLEEHEGTEELAAAWPRARKYVGWPMFFAMRAAR